MLRTRKESVKIRHKRIRKNMKGSALQPRLSVFKSTRHIYVQLIDDTKSVTLVSASTLDPKFKEKMRTTGNIAAAKLVGELIAQKALEKGFKKVVFDRGGFPYHGRIKALADSARQMGLEF